MEMLNLMEEKGSILQNGWIALNDDDKALYAKLKKSIDITKNDDALTEAKEKFDFLCMKKLTGKEKARLVEIDTEITPLKEFLDDAAFHRGQIKLEIGTYALAFFQANSLDSLRFDSEKCVLIVDFTKWGMVDKGNVHCFVVSVLSQGETEEGISFIADTILFII